MNLKERAKRLSIYLPAIFIALRHKNLPVIAKIFAAITIGYALSPVDLIPDFIPFLGYIDDLVILPLLVSLTLKFIPKEIMVECLEKAQDWWKNGRPKKWYYAIPVVLLWFLIFLLIVWKIIK